MNGAREILKLAIQNFQGGNNYMIDFFTFPLVVLGGNRKENNLDEVKKEAQF